MIFAGAAQCKKSRIGKSTFGTQFVPLAGTLLGKRQAPEKTMAARVLVVIVSADDGHWLASCLQALSASTFRSIDILVVDNDCSDHTHHVCKQAGNSVRLVKTANRLGFASCNNLGLRVAVDENYEYVYMLNPDTIIHDKAIDKLVEFLDRHPTYGVAGSVQIKYDVSGWETLNEWSKITLEEAAALGSTPRVHNGYQVLDHYYVQGAALLMRTGLIGKIGMLDPVYRSFYEETDFCRRCRLSGFEIALLMDSKVKHVGGGNWKRTARGRRERDFLYLRNQFIYFLSLPLSATETIRAAMSLVCRQLRLIYCGLDDLILPIWRYPSIILAVLARVPEIACLRKRNSTIMAGVDTIAVEFTAIGRE